MENRKLLTLALASCILVSSHVALCAETKKVKPSTKALKGAVSDYKIEYINKNWWDRFNDPVLSDYILKASNANHDLKIATLKVYEAQALVSQSFGKELPSANIDLGFSRSKTSDNIWKGSSKVASTTSNNFLFPVNVNYELDLWRKNHDATLKVKKELQAVKYDEKAIYISLTSAIAAAYFNSIKTDKLISLQKDIISLRQEILKLTRLKNDNGLCSVTEVISADKALTEAQSGLNDLEKQQSVFLNQLAVLTGENIDNALRLKRTSIDEVELIKNLPLTVNSEIVLARPDVLIAETDLQKSKIDVKLARKDFLPDISLSGEFGFNASALSKGFDSNSYIGSFGVGILQDIFSGGQKRAWLKAKKYRYEQMLENYQRTILTSFQEVNDTLVSVKTDKQKDVYNISRINFEQKNLDLMNLKYNEGVISYMDTLQYKERLIQLQKERIQSKTDCLIDSLSLYKAIGGKNLSSDSDKTL